MAKGRRHLFSVFVVDRMEKATIAQASLVSWQAAYRGEIF
jgi:hypothetical protein